MSPRFPTSAPPMGCWSHWCLDTRWVVPVEQSGLDVVPLSTSTSTWQRRSLLTNHHPTPLFLRGQCVWFSLRDIILCLPVHWSFQDPFSHKLCNLPSSANPQMQDITYVPRLLCQVCPLQSAALEKLYSTPFPTRHFALLDPEEAIMLGGLGGGGLWH